PPGRRTEPNGSEDEQWVKKAIRPPAPSEPELGENQDDKQEMQRPKPFPPGQPLEHRIRKPDGVRGVPRIIDRDPLADSPCHAPPARAGEVEPLHLMPRIGHRPSIGRARSPLECAGGG